MSGAPDLPASGMLHVQVAEDCTLDGGTWHLTTDQHGAPTAQISPPAVPMFQQVVEYLETKPVPPGGSMRRAYWDSTYRLVNMEELSLGAYPSGVQMGNPS